MTEIAFDKYAMKGGYHWRKYFGPGHRINAGTRARYDTIIDVLRANGIGKSSRMLDVGCGAAALAELYALSAALGRAVRLSVNILAKLGYNAFSRPAGFRAWSAQMAVAQKPRDPQA